MVTTHSSDAPPTPNGYRAPYGFGYPKLGMNLGAVALVLVFSPLLGALTWLLQGRFPLSGSIGLGVVLRSLAVAVSTILVHELIHGLAYRILGYRVSYGVYWKLGFYTAALRQFQKRDHIIISALAPLVLLSLLLLPMLAIRNTLIVEMAFIALLVNISGAFGDMYLTWRLSRVPRRTLAYDTDSSHSFIYEPEQSII
ncbi:MAG: DUF3267 domain-containing protein [Anaerolineae bacterium]